MEQCGNCKFWKEDYSSEGRKEPAIRFGVCRRHSPVLHDGYKKHPSANDNDWCGDWELKAVGKTSTE